MLRRSVELIRHGIGKCRGSSPLCIALGSLQRLVNDVLDIVLVQCETVFPSFLAQGVEIETGVGDLFLLPSPLRTVRSNELFSSKYGFQLDGLKTVQVRANYPVVVTMVGKTLEIV